MKSTVSIFNIPIPEKSNPQPKTPQEKISAELSNFILDLDKDYPAQAFAVYRTAVKLKPRNIEKEYTYCTNCRKPSENHQSAATTAHDLSKIVDSSTDLKLEDLLKPNFSVSSFSAGDNLCHKCRYIF